MAKPEARLALPVDGILPELLAQLEAGRNVVLEATPGGGKTTRVPPALLAARFRGDREIVVLEPRRLAAKMAAHRVAYELGEPIGETVGYQFRFENVAGPRTRIRFLTEGMFVRRMLSDPRLERVAAVVVDEFHERHLQGDFALAALKKLQTTVRPDLRIVVMSATLDVQGIAAYLGDAKVISVETRRFDVQLEYLSAKEHGEDRYLDQLVAAAARRTKAQDGDTLVFLPGVADIRRAQTALAGFAAEEDLLVLPLYGDLSREEQDRAVFPNVKRKIILSTNVAETSLTIDGVRTVIDSGLARQASYSWWSGLPALRTKPVSRASAIQRAGRAGRTAPGRCLRLYSKESFDTRPAFETPEIQRADLAQTILELHALGVRDSREFPWFDAPLAASLEASERLLYRLGAVDKGGGLTAFGRRMAEMPAHPRLTRLVLEGERLGLAREACTLAAMLSEGRTESLDLVAELQNYRAHGTAERARDQLFRHCEKRPQATGSDIRRALLAAFPDRVAKRRQLAANIDRNRSGQRVELVFGTGGSAGIENSALLASAGEYYIAVDVEERSKATRICRSICAIEPEWLFDQEPEGVVEVNEVTWDEERERVTAHARILYDGLVLSEERAAPDAEKAATVLAKVAMAVGVEKFCPPEDLANLTQRVRFVRDQLPDPELPDLGGDGLRVLLEKLCLGKSSFKEIREADLLGELLYTLSPEQRQKLEKFAPEFVALPGGRCVKVRYEPGKPPWVESRLQDFMGMKTGPTVMGGRVALVLHLLAPNYRAVQVTADLAGFWARVYPELRRELGRRYPRHAWPEDPHQIPPPRAPRGR